MRFAFIVSCFAVTVLAVPFGCSESNNQDPPATTPEIPAGCADLQSCCEQLEESAARSCLDALVSHANSPNAETWCHGILGSYQSAGLCPGGATGGGGQGGASGAGGKDAGPDSSAGSGGKPTCPSHDECVTGTAIPSSCSSCAANVCDALPSCCTSSWTSSCVNKAKAVCPECATGNGGSSGAGGSSGQGGSEAGSGGVGGTGGVAGQGGTAATGGQGPCPHDECTVGAALDSSCSSCVTEVCLQDPFCCASKWNTYCVDSAKIHCNKCGGAGGSSGTCVHSECITGVALDSLCSWCVATVCDADPYCCTTKWNSYCVDGAIGYCNLCN